MLISGCAISATRDTRSGVQERGQTSSAGNGSFDLNSLTRIYLPLYLNMSRCPRLRSGRGALKEELAPIPAANALFSLLSTPNPWVVPLALT